MQSTDTPTKSTKRTGPAYLDALIEYMKDVREYLATATGTAAQVKRRITDLAKPHKIAPLAKCEMLANGYIDPETFQWKRGEPSQEDAKELRELMLARIRENKRKRSIKVNGSSEETNKPPKPEIDLPDLKKVGHILITVSMDETGRAHIDCKRHNLNHLELISTLSETLKNFPAKITKA